LSVFGAAYSDSHHDGEAEGGAEEQDHNIFRAHGTNLSKELLASEKG
jgi:hypothetical protein